MTTSSQKDPPFFTIMHITLIGISGFVNSSVAESAIVFWVLNIFCSLLCLLSCSFHSHHHIITHSSFTILWLFPSETMNTFCKLSRLASWRQAVTLSAPAYRGFSTPSFDGEMSELYAIVAKQHRHKNGMLMIVTMLCYHLTNLLFNDLCGVSNALLYHLILLSLTASFLCWTTCFLLSSSLLTNSPLVFGSGPWLKMLTATESALANKDGPLILLDLASGPGEPGLTIAQHMPQVGGEWLGR